MVQPLLLFARTGCYFSLLKYTNTNGRLKEGCHQKTLSSAGKVNLVKLLKLLNQQKNSLRICHFKILFLRFFSQNLVGIRDVSLQFLRK